MMIEKEKGIYILELSVELDEDDIRTLKKYGQIRNDGSEPTEENLKGYCEILLGSAIENLAKKYYEEELEEYALQESKELREIETGESALVVAGHLEEMMNGQYPGDFRTIRESVKKQIPRETGELYKTELEELPGKYILSGNCPICGSAAPKKHRYCWNCGQRLKWPKN